MGSFRWLVAPLLLLSPVALSGCALPPAVVVGSYAADGVSYWATGKTVTDHGLSAVTGHDCGVVRAIFAGKPLCVTDNERGKQVPIVQGKPSSAMAVAEAPRRRLGPIAPPAAATAADRYVAVGSFIDKANAERASRHYAELKATIVPVDVNGRRFHRVVVGPLTATAAASLKARLAAEAATGGAG